MIIQMEGPGADAAREDLAALATTWGHTLTDEPVPPRTQPGGERGVDPVALTALIVSLPSAALAVYDLADRIRKRRRAADLIDHAKQQAARRVTLYVITRQAPVELSTLDPDRLLDLLDSEDPKA